MLFVRFLQLLPPEPRSLCAGLPMQLIPARGRKPEYFRHGAAVRLFRIRLSAGQALQKSI